VTVVSPVGLHSLQPRDTDFSRVRAWNIDSLAKYYRQVRDTVSGAVSAPGFSECRRRVAADGAVRSPPVTGGSRAHANGVLQLWRTTRRCLLPLACFPSF
jgi:hypothetical protein